MGNRPRAGLLFTLWAGSSHGASQYIVQDGFEDPCHVDADRDRLANCVEFALQSGRFDADTDNDGLGDGDEVLGTQFALDLPSLGVSPLRRDLLLEIDWVDDNTGCLFHSHRPTPATIAAIQAVFAQIPLANPDGSTGINLIVDYGKGSLLSGGSVVPAVGGTVSLEQLYAAMQPAHFASNRRGYFRYSIHAHSVGAAKPYSGVAGADTHIVSLGCNTTPGYVTHVVAHELGHNLGLQHGGGQGLCDNKPNYNSIMNYAYLYHGVDIDCDRFPDGVAHIGFSDGTRRSLAKSSLVEADGVCAATHPLAKPVDWNANGFIDPDPVAVDLACPGTDVLQDWNDVLQMRLAPYTLPNAAPPSPMPVGEVCPPPPGEGA